MFSKERRLKAIEDEQNRLHSLRHSLFDRLLELVYRICNNNILESISSNKCYFKNIFTDIASGPQFEISVCFNSEGVMSTDPTLEEHSKSFENIFLNIENVLFQNKEYQAFLKDLNAMQFDQRLWDLKELFV